MFGRLKNLATVWGWWFLSWAARRKRATPSAFFIALSVLAAFRSASTGGQRVVAGLLLFLLAGFGLLALDSHRSRRALPETVARPSHWSIWLSQFTLASVLSVMGMVRLWAAPFVLAPLAAGCVWCRVEAGFHNPPPEAVYLPGADRAFWDAARVRRLARTWHQLAQAKQLGERAAGQPSSFRPDVLEKVEIDGIGPRLIIRIGVGRSLKSFAANSQELRAAFNVFRCDVQAVGNDRVGLRLVRVDPFAGAAVLPDHDIFRRAPVGTAWELGVSEDGMPVKLDITRGGHLLIAGTTGSGKTTCVAGLIAHVLRMGDSAVVCVADPHATIVPAYRDLLSWSHEWSDPERLYRMLQWVVAEFDRRKPYFEKWQVGTFEPHHFSSELPLIVLVIDEVAVFQTGPRGNEISELLRRVVAEGRKFGARAVLCSQRPSAITMLTSIRDQLFERICFAMESRAGVTMVMPALENPRDLLGSVPAGVGYVRVAGVPIRFRAYNIDPYDVAQRLRDEGFRTRPAPIPIRQSQTSPKKSETLLDLRIAGEISQGTFDRLGDITLPAAAAFSEQDLRAMKGHHESSIERLRVALERRELSFRTE